METGINNQKIYNNLTMKQFNNKKIAVAMSGGVDSSTTAFLLQKKGYEVVGLFMRLGNKSGGAENAARRVANKLGIKFYPINLTPEFRAEVVDYFLDCYKNGLTPNPCVKCNKVIKFGKLLEMAEKLGADYIATGHYVRKDKVNCEARESALGQKKGKEYRVYKGGDSIKDQSYFLYNLNQDNLARILFPLGEYKKEEIKKIAKKAGLPNLKSESQDICFVDGEHNDFLREYISAKSGPIKDIKGKIVGEHTGLPFYTIGQRKGIEIGGTGPYYVVDFDYDKNILFVTDDSQDKKLYSDSLIFSDANFIRKLKFPLKCKAMIRYNQKEVDCTVEPMATKKNKYFVKFNKPQRAITEGQSIVFYLKDEVIGGGIICS